MHSLHIFSSVSLLTTFILTLQLSSSAMANTAEVSCRMKAKEIAAETYKGCMTEVRQSQLEQIRNEYKEELARIKNQYDKKLQKLSGKASEKDEMKVKLKDIPEPKKGSKASARSANTRGALPAKKGGPIRSQVIDLSTPSEPTVSMNEPVVQAAVDMEQTETSEAIQSESRLKSDQDISGELEVVELPTQE